MNSFVGRLLEALNGEPRPSARLLDFPELVQSPRRQRLVFEQTPQGERLARATFGLFIQTAAEVAVERASAVGIRQDPVSFVDLLDEFLRRFLLHTLPRRFVRIRFFGFMAGPRRSRMLQLARRLLETGVECGVPPTAPTPTSYQCPVCATPMIFIERLTAAMVRRAVAAHQDAINDSS